MKTATKRGEGTKTKLTSDIEAALKTYRPPDMGGIKINQMRPRPTAYEVPVEHGTTAQGIIDCVRVCEYFDGEYPSGEPKILIVCFEIKITKADFKSTHGHNFVGNLNYYVVPNSIYNDIKDDVPDGIGIIVYHDNSYCGLRRRKDAAYKEMDDNAQKWLLLSVLNRIYNRGRRAETEGEAV